MPTKPHHRVADPAPIEVSDTSSFRKKRLIPAFFIDNDFLVPNLGNLGGTIFARRFRAVSITVHGIDSPPPSVPLGPGSLWRVVLNGTMLLKPTIDAFVEIKFGSVNVTSAVLGTGTIEFSNSLMKIQAFVSGKKQFDVSVAQPTPGFGVTIQFCPGGVCS
jgi:hypothetical protein